VAGLEAYIKSFFRYRAYKSVFTGHFYRPRPYEICVWKQTLSERCGFNLGLAYIVPKSPIEDSVAATSLAYFSEMLELGDSYSLYSNTTVLYKGF